MLWNEIHNYTVHYGKRVLKDIPASLICDNKYVYSKDIKSTFVGIIKESFVVSLEAS
jgi:hypothetical protein